MDDQSLSVFAWGDPSDPRTFSGYSANLTQSLRSCGLIRNEYSAKNIKLIDALSGAITISRKKNKLFEVSRRWMWSRGGRKRLGNRVSRKILNANDCGPVLQIGTLIELHPDCGDHYMLTDMTIPQAVKAGHFPVSKLSSQELENVIREERRIIATAKHIFAISEWTKRSIVNDLGVDEQNVTVIYAGSNLNAKAAPDFRRSSKSILFVGIDWERKGGPILIEAFKLVRQRVPSANLRIVGCSPEITEPGVQIVGFLDSRDTSQKKSLLNEFLSASCFCLPTLFDPFPNVLIEAGSVGLPAIAFDNGSRREVIVDEVTGVLAKRETASELAEAIVDVIKNDDRCAAMGKAAWTHINSNFTWDIVVSKISNVLRCAAR